MAELKTKQTDASVPDFLSAIENQQVRADCRTIAEIMQKATGAPPRMWGTSIVGFGAHRYKGASGKETDWMMTAFAPRSQNITLYLMSGLDSHTDLLAKLGPHSRGKGCLHIKRLSDVHVPTLKKLVKTSVDQVRRTAGATSARRQRGGARG